LQISAVKCHSYGDAVSTEGRINASACIFVSVERRFSCNSSPLLENQFRILVDDDDDSHSKRALQMDDSSWNAQIDITGEQCASVDAFDRLCYDDEEEFFKD